MASENYIVRQIEEIVEGEHSRWLIGVTDEPIKRKAELGNSLTWLHWKADTEKEARNVERYFLGMGMQISVKTSKPAVYVYILRVDS
ncbi:MAG: hypothetical protein ACE5G1_07875 [bacterium]